MHNALAAISVTRYYAMLLITSVSCRCLRRVAGRRRRLALSVCRLVGVYSAYTLQCVVNVIVLASFNILVPKSSERFCFRSRFSPNSFISTPWRLVVQTDN